MAYSITYTTAGVTYDLNGINAGLGITIKYLGDQGFGMAPIQRITQRGPLQQGDTDVGYRLNPRVIQLPLLVEAMTMDAGYTARKGLVKIFTPANGAGILRVTTDLYDRAILVVPMGGLDFNQDPQSGYHIRTVVQLRAADPTWYDPTIVNAAQTPTITGTPTPVPLTIPWTAGSSSINSTLNFTYDGDFISYPIISVTGPITDLLITHTTTGYTIGVTGTIVVGDTWTFDLRYGQKTVTDQAGVNQIANLTSGSALADFAIILGTNTITVSGTTTTSASTVNITYYTRYTGV
jgi:hypothetical protein